MSDPNFRDPRLDPEPFREDELRARRMEALNGSNAMWGWIAGAVVLALVLVFVFARSQDVNTASNSVPTPPAATNGMAPPAQPAPPATATKPAPSTTGQGSAQ
jgi:hypothetical protein